MFTLHAQLLHDTIAVGQFELSLVLLMNDRLYPWCILVPQREGVRELYQLDNTDRQLLLEESCLLAETMQRIFVADKMNIAALGNLVPQLHLHHIARYKTDPAWPAPVWGKLASQAYSDAQAQGRLRDLCHALHGQARFTAVN